jgi:SAM-dependent methyltransferase
MMHEQANRKEAELLEVEYILGHSPDELRRLILQAEVLRPITERLLKEAGIKLGMRVLDLGCGTGDVAMLAAELVGRRATWWASSAATKLFALHAIEHPVPDMAISNSAAVPQKISWISPLSI